MASSREHLAGLTVMDFPSVRLVVTCSLRVFSTEQASTCAAGTADQRTQQGLPRAQRAPPEPTVMPVQPTEQQQDQRSRDRGHKTRACGGALSDVGGVFHHAGVEGRASRPAPERRSYGSSASFSDPDGNRWLLQEVKTRAPGR